MKPFLFTYWNVDIEVQSLMNVFSSGLIAVVSDCWFTAAAGFPSIRTDSIYGCLDFTLEGFVFSVPCFTLIVTSCLFSLCWWLGAFTCVQLSPSPLVKPLYTCFLAFDPCSLVCLWGLSCLLSFHAGLFYNSVLFLFFVSCHAFRFLYRLCSRCLGLCCGFDFTFHFGLFCLFLIKYCATNSPHLNPFWIFHIMATLNSSSNCQLWDDRNKLL